MLPTATGINPPLHEETHNWQPTNWEVMKVILRNCRGTFPERAAEQDPPPN